MRKRVVVWRRRATAVLVLWCGVAPAAWSGQEVPAELQAAIIARMLSYDRSLKGRVGPALVVGIVVKATDQGAAKVQSETQKVFTAQASVQGVPLSTKAYAYSDPAEFSRWLRTEGIDVLYVAAGLESQMESIRDACAQHHVVGVSPVRAFVKQGLALGVVSKGEGAGILVNLAAAKAAGMDLDPKLLSLAEVLY